MCDSFTQTDIEQFKEGVFYNLYQKLGAHCCVRNAKEGVRFSVWAPAAKSVSVIGDFNQWDRLQNPLKMLYNNSGIWEGFVEGVDVGGLYKFSIQTQKGVWKDKIDPLGFSFEKSPNISSIVHKSHYTWEDDEWIAQRLQQDYKQIPMSIYEMHIGSWKDKSSDSQDDFITYRTLADKLIPYLIEMNYTHVELLPVFEHPYYPSWGYQLLGFFAPTSRYGSPDDLKFFIDQCHRNNIGVILDWVPSHFPEDNHGLSNYDGTHLYEKADIHPDWGSCIVNLGSLEVTSFLISNAIFWCEKFHVDGLRVDAVASMLYLNYSRKPKEWEPNFLGGVENLEAVAFLRRLNVELKRRHSDVLIMAEESTAWPKVSGGVKDGGLGFDMKWNMGWMNDTLEYFSTPEEKRRLKHNKLTFSFNYAFNENFLMSLSHDEVVHGKSSLLGKMPGKDIEKFNNLKCLYGYMYAHPGKKLLFMGGEVASWNEWNHDTSLEWELLNHVPHLNVQQWIKNLNYIYKTEPALYLKDFTSDGFQWLCDSDDDELLTFIRQSGDIKDSIVFIGHFTSSVIKKYRIGVPSGGVWEVLLDSDDSKVEYITQDKLWNNQPYSIEVTINPLSISFLKRKS
ncbi:MAG: 1,4-alpha-glucan branching enzyme [Candidatus Omnitrophota bacterium]